MCGINGVYAHHPDAPRVDREKVLRARDSMAARGPDGAGAWFSEDGRVGLGHRRLAIIDLSEAGAQPMASEDGRFTVTFNGEIFNYRALRTELEAQGVRFRSHSDTEVLLHLYRRDGEAMVDSLRGMFAFAIWDAERTVLFLARDPHGIKPLYYADDGRSFRFASQTSALKAGGGIDLAPDPAGMAGFLLWGSVPEPYTLHRGMRLLTAGSTLRVTAGGMERPRRYWRLGERMRRAQELAAGVPAGQEREYLRAALLDSVRAHMLADVPVGAFLSAGLDSSTLVGLAREVSGTPLQTITLSFDEFQGRPNDECPMAGRIARHLDVAHRCIVLPAGEQEQELDRFFAAMDQPTIDGINTWFVSEAAASAGLKVALSGLGGDELLGGYATFARVPDTMARAGRSPLGHFPRLYLWGHRVLAGLAKLPPNDAGLHLLGRHPHGAYALAKGVFMPWELGQVLDGDLARAGLQVLTEGDAALEEPLENHNGFEQVAYLESVRYMRNQLLRDTDWISMSHSLEIRVPLVDRVLTESVIGLAAAGRLGQGKAMLHTTLDQGLPAEAVSRPKTGFTVPTWKWLRHHPGLDIWKRVPMLRQPRFNDYRRWAYTLLARQPGMEEYMRRQR